MKKDKIYWECSKCGARSSVYIGRCPQCHEFNTYVKVTENNLNENNNISTNKKTQRLIDIKSDSIVRLKTGIGEFDRVVGGGIVSDSINILTAVPGAGKSTLLLSVANKIAEQGKNILYISGEESESQIKLRADRILDKTSENIYIRSETNIDIIFNEIDKIKPALLIIDSIQMMYSNKCDGVVGGDKQLIYVASKLLEKAKKSDSTFSIFFVSQMTKEDVIRGSRELEHMVDGVFTLTMEDESGTLRMLRCNKNRFGDVSEVGLFQMTEEGLCEISDPNKYFITSRILPVYGSAVTTIKEGARTIALEINTLSEDNSFSYPTRISQGISKDFLQIILAVLGNKILPVIKRKDIYLQTSNGLVIKDTSVGLGIAASVYSSIKKLPIKNDCVFIGEISLTGEIKKVPYIDKIINDLQRMGFNTVVIPVGNTIKKHPGIKIIECQNIVEMGKIMSKI